MASKKTTPKSKTTRPRASLGRQITPKNLSLASGSTQLLFDGPVFGERPEGYVIANLDVSSFAKVRIAWSCNLSFISTLVLSSDFPLALLQYTDSPKPFYNWSTIVLDVPGTTLKFVKQGVSQPGTMDLKIWGR